ncbi:MAG: hypothetical protein OEO23_06565 [Gemmatimonadota bacterium]|nr:hypothetical protein [Gemmatimonadota bacterium]
MRKWPVVALALLSFGCGESDPVLVVSGDPDGPRNVSAAYYNLGVDVTWDLSPGWNGEAFRVYGKRASDADFFFIAEVTSCAEGSCLYRDLNVLSDVTYEYFVAAVDPDTGSEASSAIVGVYVPLPIPPAVPTNLAGVALDNAAYLIWSDAPASEGDFSFYRVYIVDGPDDLLLGETDSPGFIDLLAVNGSTFTYFVTSVDDQGHESGGSFLVEVTPRPDYTGELMNTYQDAPGNAGFQFQESEDAAAVMSGDDPDRHFRLESDVDGLWLVPGPGVEIYPTGQFTSALKCGVGADGDCTSWEVAPTSGYAFGDVPVDAEFTYMFRVPGFGGGLNYGAIRVTLLGQDQAGDDVMVFDWAYQIQEGNPNLSTAEGSVLR